MKKPGKQKKRGVFVASVAIVLALSAILLSCPAVSLRSNAEKIVTQADIDAKKAQVYTAGKNTDKMKKQLSEAKADEKALVAQLEAIENTINALNDQIELTASLIEDYGVLIAENTEEYEEQKKAHAELLSSYADHFRAARESGTPSVLELIMSAKSLSDLLVSLERSGDILSFDRKVMTELEIKSNALSEKIDGITAMRDEQVRLQKKLESDKAAAEAQIEEWNAEVVAIRAKINEDYSALDALVALEEKRDKELKDLIKLKAKQDAQRPTDEDYLWPLSTKYLRISSPFGYRTHPIYGDTRFHKGIDIPADEGTPILASKSGKVTVVSYTSSRGYYVVVDHGGGYSTLYQHIKKGTIKVKVGEKVVRGQQLAGVGTTGDSTGFHLHFEILKNGTPQNPIESTMKYIFDGKLDKVLEHVYGNLK